MDLKFVDLIGTWQHFTIPASELTEDLFKDGSGLDGSSIRGWKAINNSDMLVVPDPATACLDPFTAVPTLSLIGNVVDPISRETYERDPRYIAQKAEAYVKKTGLADTIYIGPELEFFFFDSIRFDQTYNAGYYFIDSVEAAWNTGRDEGPNLGYKVPYRQGYFPCPPTDHLHDLRSEMMRAMLDCGLPVESHHHQKASGGQCAINIRYDELVPTADNVLKYKYVVKNVARRHGRT
ncbi:MAG TPA: glutamine synthetase beta-grasp domain-containing protein, partial [Nitrospira sp.]|nr:glutamine synthetase beta-grasp domain-containing protein [Nitrospira sp.]